MEHIRLYDHRVVTEWHYPSVLGSVSISASPSYIKLLQQAHSVIHFMPTDSPQT